MSCLSGIFNHSELPQQIQRQSIDLESKITFGNCSTHQKKIEFICKEYDCRQKGCSLLCNKCLLQHKKQGHDWMTTQNFLTPNIRKIITRHQSQSNKQLEQALCSVQTQIKQLEIYIKDQLESSRQKFSKSIKYMQQQYQITISDSIDDEMLINSHNIQKLLNIFEIQEKNYIWIGEMQTNIKKMVRQIKKSFKYLLQDIDNILIVSKWQRKQQFIDQFQQFYKHLHLHTSNDRTFYKFAADSKHQNVTLNQALNQATYFQSIPSKPTAIANKYLSREHNRIGFQILKMETKALFFESTMVMVGICNPSVVKSFGYRKVNQFGRGTYLISSIGCVYHSNDQNLNNKDLVGWGFSQGDKIIVEIIFDTNCKIKFTKKGRFFDNTYEMLLNLNEFQVKKLKPIVCFDAEQGGIIKIFDVIDQEI